MQFEHRARDRTPKSCHAIECAILIEDQVGLRIGTVGAVFKDIEHVSVHSVFPAAGGVSLNNVPVPPPTLRIPSLVVP